MSGSAAGRQHQGGSRADRAENPHIGRRYGGTNVPILTGLGAALQPATAEQLRKLLDALLPGQDLSLPVTL
jgi:glycine/D-amino acid oxidase-like deaminating enzyme